MNQIRLMIVLLNFCVNCLLLIATNQITGDDSTWGELFAGAGIGALYGWGCMIPALSFLRQYYWRAVCFLLMSGQVFGWNLGGMKRGALFVLVSLTLQGASVLIGRDGFLPMILITAATWTVVTFSSVFRKTVPLEIRSNRETVRIIALRDTGNSLRDPISGEQVIIVGSDTAGKLTGLTDRQLKEPLLTLSKMRIPGLRIIPYHSVGQENGMMLAMRFPNVIIGGKMQSRIVAFAPQIIGGDRFQALTGGTI